MESASSSVGVRSERFMPLRGSQRVLSPSNATSFINGVQGNRGKEGAADQACAVQAGQPDPPSVEQAYL